MGILVLFGTSLLIFTIARVVPGDVATIALGARATEAAKEALRMEMNLYDPFPVQYVKWLTSAVTNPVVSVIRFAALPVGAASRMSAPSLSK